MSVTTRRRAPWRAATAFAALSSALVLMAAVRVAPASAASPGRGGFVPITPFRLLDTRESRGLPYTGPAFGTGETRTFNVYSAGNFQIPNGQVGSVALNVTAVDSAGAGHLVVWPSDAPKPTASVLNYGGGDTVPNAVAVKVSAAGSFNVYAHIATHVVVDVMGYYAPAPGDSPDGGGFVGVTPKRLMDTRERIGASTLGDGGEVTLGVTGAGAAPGSASAVVLNVTVTNPTNGGFVSVWPSGVAQPTVSNLNYVRGQTVANQVTVKVGSGGSVEVFSKFRTDVIVDIMGWYAGGSPAPGGFVPLSPVRVMDSRLILGDVNYDAVTDSVILHLLGGNGLPTSGVGAVSLNITAVEPDAASYLTVWPDGAARPLSSNLNFVVTQTVPNAVSVGLGNEGGVEFYSPAFMDLVADLGGYFTRA